MISPPLENQVTKAKLFLVNLSDTNFCNFSFSLLVEKPLKLFSLLSAHIMH